MRKAAPQEDSRVKSGHNECNEPAPISSLFKHMLLAGAVGCWRAVQTASPFTQLPPETSERGNLITGFAESSGHDDNRAGLAGSQQLLMILGYDPTPIGGVYCPKKQAALSALLKRRCLAAGATKRPNFLAKMMEAVQAPSPCGLIDPDKCLRPEVACQPQQTFSFADAAAIGFAVVDMTSDGKMLLFAVPL